MSASRGIPTPDSTLYDLHANVHLHIYSSSGRQVRCFLGVRSRTEREEKDTILFGSGREFMVCDRKEEPDGTVHIYVREICLGLINPVIWLDDNRNSAAFSRIHRYIQKQS